MKWDLYSAIDARTGGDPTVYASETGASKSVVELAKFGKGPHTVGAEAARLFVDRTVTNDPASQYQIEALRVWAHNALFFASDPKSTDRNRDSLRVKAVVWSRRINLNGDPIGRWEYEEVPLD